MKKFTMVMRCGDPKASAESMMYTLVGDNYELQTILGASLVKAIQSNQIDVLNLGVENGKLVSTNGAMKNYTLVDTQGNLVDKPRAVILNRVEVNGELAGYTIFNTSGVLQEVNITRAAALAKANLIANGKIRHTQSGDIVASIAGNYPLRLIEVAKAKDESIGVQILFTGCALGNNKQIKYAGVIVDAKSAATMTKYHEKLVKANKKLIEAVNEMTGIDESNSLGIKLTGSAGFYGVYPLDIAFELVEKADGKIKLPMGSLMIACTDYTDNKTESSLRLSKECSIMTDGVIKGSVKTSDALRKYAKTIIDKFKTYTIE